MYSFVTIIAHWNRSLFASSYNISVQNSTIHNIMCIYSPLLGGCYDHDNTINPLPRCAEWLYLPIAFSSL